MSWSIVDQIDALLDEVSAYQCSRFRRVTVHHADTKAAKEFVSEVDIRSEERLAAGLHHILPEAGFFGEETGRSGNAALRWVVDPLDGTTNFLSGLDHFAISVALVDVQGPRIGVVRKPVTAERFAAVRGLGARHNGASLPSLPTTTIDRALIGTGFPYRSADLHNPFFACASEVLAASRGIRRFGAAAIDLAYVAAGQLQGFWESDLQPYDVAAALVMLKETGAGITALRSQPYDLFHDRMLVAGLPGVHAELCAIVDRHYR